jgi:hypothetical protein
VLCSGATRRNIVTRFKLPIESIFSMLVSLDQKIGNENLGGGTPEDLRRQKISDSSNLWSNTA